jgi:hypothetical protein
MRVKVEPISHRTDSHNYLTFGYPAHRYSPECYSVYFTMLGLMESISTAASRTANLVES